MSAIIVDHLSFNYGSTPILRELSAAVDQEFVAIIGPNGGGKTTFLNLLMGFLTPTAGSIKIFGLPPKEARPLIGWVPQHFAFDRDFPLSVLDVVLMGRLSKLSLWGRYRTEDRQAALAALQMVGMQAQASRSFSRLSGGQAQRVLLARALVGNPKLLLLDEATANVDLAAQADIYAILQRLKSSLTILMVTHDLKAITPAVDRIFCIDHELTALSHEQVCSHFSLGLYHPRSGA